MNFFQLAQSSKSQTKSPMSSASFNLPSVLPVEPQIQPSFVKKVTFASTSNDLESQKKDESEDVEVTGENMNVIIEKMENGLKNCLLWVKEQIDLFEKMSKDMDDAKCKINEFREKNKI